MILKNMMDSKNRRLSRKMCGAYRRIKWKAHQNTAVSYASVKDMALKSAVEPKRNYLKHYPFREFRNRKGNL